MDNAIYTLTLPNAKHKPKAISMLCANSGAY